jgi:hypothetical protein
MATNCEIYTYMMACERDDRPNRLSACVLGGVTQQLSCKSKCLLVVSQSQGIILRREVAIHSLEDEVL